MRKCRKLRFLFSKTLANKLYALEHFYVMSCDNLKEIISFDEVEVEQEFSQIDVFGVHLPSHSRTLKS